MGTHPSNPSYELETNRHLQDLLREHPDLLGKEIAKKYGPVRNLVLWAKTKDVDTNAAISRNFRFSSRSFL